MAAETALTYRLQGIPRACDKNDVQDLVSRLLGVNRSRVLVRSLAQHPLQDDSKIATLSLLEKPADFASKQKTNAWSFQEPDENVAGGFINFTLDTHFHGFTPLHHIEDEQCQTDLIVLSGLNGHAFGSFKAKGLDFMWIRDSLPTHFPSSRLFIYGYDTTMIQSASHQSILDLGSQLASSLRGLVSAGSKAFQWSRSLILLGHSLGGLVVEQAIVEMSPRSPSISTGNERILRSIRGILLFGVPQMGMSVEALKTMVKEQPNEDLVTSLKVDSAFLQLQQENFRKARLSMNDTSVVAFFETQETPTVQNVSGKWQTTGPSKLLVAKTSATSMSDSSVPINRNHSEIVKFQPNDADYDRVLSELQRLREGIHEQQPNIEAEPPTDKEIEALRSLGFPEQHQRRDEICPGEDTCEWVTSNTTFQNWFRNQEDFELRMLWIRGHPGTGKSTLMKFTWQHLTRRLPTSMTLASFFFHARGSSLQQSRMGFLRSILHQLAFRLPEFRRCLMQRYGEKRTVTPTLQWTESELQELIQNALDLCKKPVCILVDALDEAGEETAGILVKWFRRLTKLPNVRIIFSCRNYPVLPSICKFAISMQMENAEDIERVVSPELRSEFTENEAQVLENDIIQKANGMFQWATLVTHSVVERYRKTLESVDTLRDVIGSLPPDLHALYDSLLSTIQESEEKDQAMKLLSWILFAADPLNLREIQHALAVDANTTARSLSDLSLIENVERAVKTFSRGLAEVKTHAHSTTAQFIHQSVVDYLKEDGFAKLTGFQERSEAFGHAEFQLSCSCIRYLLMEDLTDSAKELKSDSRNPTENFDETFPLASYARKYWILHIIHVEFYGYDQKSLLDIIPWIREDTVPLHFTFAWDCYFFGEKREILFMDQVTSSLVPNVRLVKPIDTCLEDLDTNGFHLSNLQYNTWDDYNCLENQTPFNLFALSGIIHVWKSLLAQFDGDCRAFTGGSIARTISGSSRKPHCDAALEHEDESPQTRELDQPSPLLCLLLGNQDIRLEEIPERLIKTCINGKYYITPLFWAVATKRGDLVCAFIDAGASMDPFCEDCYGAKVSTYEVAILLEHTEIMGQLIDAHGKGPCPTNLVSALHLAIGTGSHAMMAMLIGKCSDCYGAAELINCRDNVYCQTALETALEYEDLSACRILISAGADPELSEDGSSLLLYCVKKYFAEGVRFLLENGADPNRGPPEWPTPLMMAMSIFEEDAIHVLLEDSRTDPNLTDAKGLTALMYLPALERGIEMIQGSSGQFDLEIKDERGETALSKAVTTARPKIVDILLTDGRADPNTRSACGWTPLMKCCFNGDPTMTQLLLSRADIDIDAQDCWGKTALYYAMIKGKTECANLLLGHPKVDLQSSKTLLASACFEAAEQGEEDFLARLPDLQPLWFAHSLMYEIYIQAQNGNRHRVIRLLEEASFVPQEDVVMAGAP